MTTHQTLLPNSSLQGLLLVNKPAGPTTYDLIRWAKPSLPDLKIGHSGTLDPFATGLVILLIGKATKRQAELMGKDKTYRCRIQFGIKTSTGDTDGEIIQKIDRPLLEADIKKSLSKFLGPLTQIPPMYSALKVGGVPLYKLARRGKVIERKERQIEIHSMEFIRFEDNILELRTRVSSGTYVRTLAEDIGESLNHCATTIALVRECIGDYRLSDSIKGEELKEMTLPTLTNYIRAFS